MNNTVLLVTAVVELCILFVIVMHSIIEWNDERKQLQELRDRQKLLARKRVRHEIVERNRALRMSSNASVISTSQPPTSRRKALIETPRRAAVASTYIGESTIADSVASPGSFSGGVEILVGGGASGSWDN